MALTWKSYVISIYSTGQSKFQPALLLYWKNRKVTVAGHWWLMPVILTTWEPEIRKIAVLGQTRPQTKSLLNPILTEESWVCWHMPVLLAMVGSIKNP
jgi:hypothetical protein